MIDNSQYDPRKQQQPVQKPAAPRVPIGPQQKPNQPPAKQGTPLLQKLVSGAGNLAQAGMDFLQNKKGEQTKLAGIIAKGAVSGTKDMAGGAAWLLEEGAKSHLEPLLQSKNSPKQLDFLKNNQASKAIYANAAAQETKDRSGLSAGEKFVYGMAQFIPTFAVPEVGGETKGASLIAKLSKSGLNNAIQSSILYNPDLMKKNSKPLKGFIDQAASNFVGGVGARATGGVLKGTVLKPMMNAAKAVGSQLNKYLSDDIVTKLTPSIMGKFNENTVSIDGKELAGILKGDKTAFDTDFFSSPQWKDVVKQYGANTENWPERITVKKPDPLPVIEAMRTPRLEASDLHDAMNMHFTNASASLAQGDLQGYSGDMAVLNEIAGEMEKRGYKVDRKLLANSVNDYANWQRDLEDFNVGVAQKEFNKSMLSNLDDKGLLKPIQAVRRTYALLKNKPGLTYDKISINYQKWAQQNGYGGFDELGEALRNEGYDVPVNDPIALVDFVNNLPTGQEVMQKLVPPTEIDPKKAMQDAIKFPHNQVDRPFAMTQAELDKITQPKENVANPDPKVSPLEALVSKGKETPGTEPTQPEPGTLAAMVGSAKQTASDIKGEAVSTLYPAGKGEGAKQASGILREYKATSANEKTLTHIQNKKYENAFGKLSKDKHIEYITNYERTGSFGLDGNAFLKRNGIDPEAYAKYYKDTTDQAHQILQDVFGLDGYVNNYIRHAFTFSDKNDAAKFVTGFTKSLQTYSTSPLKQRKFATLQDALDYMAENGIKGKPVETNPETLRQWTITNAKSAQAFAFAKAELKNTGLMRHLKPGSSLLPNEEYINDKWANVMFKGESGLTLGGRYVAPKEVATLINNAVSDGLFENSPILNFLQNINNHLNQFQLGISAFHLATTTVNSAASELGLGMQEFLNTKGFNIGMRTRGVARIVKAGSVIEPLIEDYLRGNAAIRKLEGGNSDSVQYLMDKVNKAGGRLNIENRYRTQSIKKFRESLSNKNLFGAAVHLLPAALESLSYPIMEKLVPRVKLGRFLTEGDSAMARATNNYTKEITKDQSRRVLGEVWDKIDNIHGELVQDNLFWSNKAKDSANMFFRSFGWSYGTLRVLGNAGKDTGGIANRLKKGGDLLTPSMGIAIAYPLISAEIGAFVNYFNTGKAPTSYKDYFFPQSGSSKPDGTPIRLSTPGYMKDLFSYWRNPLQTLLNKASPELQAAQEIFQNKDYYGVMLVNPNDPKGTQAEQLGSYILSRLMPFSLQSVVNIQSSQNQSSQLSPAEVTESVLGFQKASAVIDNTNTQNAIETAYNQYSGQKTLTPEEAQVNKEKSDAKKAAATGDYSKLRALVKQGVYTAKGARTVMTTQRKNKMRGVTGSQSLFKLLPTDQQINLYNQMTPQEKVQYAKFLNRQAKATLAGRE